MSTKEKAMRRWFYVLLAWILAGCGLKPYLPSGPSLSDSAQQAWLAQARVPVHYSGPPRVPFPIVPFQTFALHYEEDIVVETEHPHWGLHEYARVMIAGQTLWIAKDADRHGVQTVSAAVPEILTWFPEVPVERRVTPFVVEETSTATVFHLTLSYRNPLDEETTVTFRSPRPPQPARQRNGSTFNHSAHLAAAVLDIPARQRQGISARMAYNGQPASIRHLLGLFPVQALLTQTQAGFVVTSMRCQPGPDATLHVERPIPGQSWPTYAQEIWHFADNHLSYHNATSAWDYHLHEGGVQLVTVSQLGKSHPLLQVVLSAPLPDLTRPFRDEVVRHFVLNINGQSHGHGRISAHTTADGARVDIRPVAPAWLATRPLRTQVLFQGEQTVDILTTRLE